MKYEHWTKVDKGKAVFVVMNNVQEARLMSTSHERPDRKSSFSCMSTTVQDIVRT